MQSACWLLLLLAERAFATMGPGRFDGLLSSRFWRRSDGALKAAWPGFGTILIDYRIGIAIRQVTAGVLELFMVFPLLMLFGGGAEVLGRWQKPLSQALAMLFFLISGFFAMPAFSFWYKGNSMCGTALGMACNGMYAFWGPFFIWIIMGVLNIGGMAADYPPLSSVQLVGAAHHGCWHFLHCGESRRVASLKKKEG